ncbi:toll-like receptor [Chamberlinius hualienensis]
MWKIVIIILNFFIIENISTERSCIVNKISKIYNYRKCDVFSFGRNSHLDVICDIIVLPHSARIVPQEETVGLKVSFTFKTTDSVANFSHSSSCLTLVYTYAKLITIRVNEENDKFKKVFVDDQSLRFLMIVVDDLKAKIKHNMNFTVGKVDFDPSCINGEIKTLTSKNLTDVDVSNCIHEVIAFEIFEDLFNFPFELDFVLDYPYLKLFDWWMDAVHNFSGILESLTLKLNFLSQPEVSEQYFKRMAKLKVQELDFHGSKFHDIRDIPPMPTLLRLDFSYNEMSTISANAFDELTNLEYLILAGNYITQIPETVFTLTKLKYLNFSHNKPKSLTNSFAINADQLSRLTALNALDLSYLKLLNVSIKHQNIAPKTSLPNFKVLNLTSTSLDQFPEAFVQMFPNLELLILSKNLFTSNSVQRLTKNNWDRLHTLDLSYNVAIQTIDVNKFCNTFRQLKNLNVANNNINRVPLVDGNTCNNMKFLNFSDNRIEVWKEERFYNTTSDLTVILSNNKIKTVNSEMLNNFKDLRKIDLQGNPFDCGDCELLKLQIWLKKSENNTVPKVTCVLPTASEGIDVTDYNFNSYHCSNKVVYWMINIVSPIAVSAAAIAAISYVIYKYRWNIRYCFFVFKVKWDTSKGDFAKLQKYPSHRWDAFVSYCTDDRDWVLNHLIPSLEDTEPKLHLSIHERDFLPGETIVDNIIQCIDNSRKSIFLISNKFIKSQWCQWEIQMAQHKLFEDHMDVLVLILLEELEQSEIPKVLKKILTTKTYLEWPKSDNATERKLFWARLRDYIGQCHCMQRDNEEEGIELY